MIDRDGRVSKDWDLSLKVVGSIYNWKNADDHVAKGAIIHSIYSLKNELTCVVLFQASEIEWHSRDKHGNYVIVAVSKLNSALDDKVVDHGSHRVHAMIQKHTQWGWGSCSSCLLSICIVCNHIHEECDSEENVEPLGKSASEIWSVEHCDHLMGNEVAQEADQRYQVRSI